MIPRECKRLAEVDFPIAEVSKHSAREKSIRHGHPSTLHLWWARRPLAACRAMLMALLLPDPSDVACPDEFRVAARKALSQTWHKVGFENDDLRNALLKFIADFANWDRSSDTTYLDTARSLVKAAHPEETPSVVDPFAGGGSIPLEALRVGCDSYASDLNPVACLILKVMLEDIPRHGAQLAAELREAGVKVKAAVARDLAEFFPPDKNGASPIAYIWARTVTCETPNCGAEIPLVRSFWLSKKANRRRALRHRVVRPHGKPPRVEFEIFEPQTDDSVQKGTVSRAKAACPCCNKTLPPERVRAQLVAQRGGADVRFDDEGRRIGGAFLLAVATLSDDTIGRQYRLAHAADYDAIWKAQQRLTKLAQKPLSNALSAVPDEPTPAGGGSGAGRAFSVQKYGMMQFGDLFTSRQKLALLSLVSGVAGTNSVGAIRDLLALVLNRVADRGASLCGWRYQADQEKVEHVFARQALPMIWDFAESVSLSESTGSFSDAVEVVATSLENGFESFSEPGQVTQADSRSPYLPEGSASLWFTDPPYYDAIPYSDLADFFHCWTRRTLGVGTQRLDYRGLETVQDETKSFNGQVKDRDFFERSMAEAFTAGRRVLNDDGVGCVVFAHKTTEGWEALLSGMTRGGWVVTASWPILTEAANRLRAQNSAALATSVHLVCRPRTEDLTGDWGEVLRELPKRVGDWMARLESEGVRGADLVFACIGPALEIFSRYARVETPDGTEKTLAEYLEKVWEVVGRVALEQVLGSPEAQARNGGAGALEEDARLTALFLWTVQATNDQAEDSSEADEEETVDDDDEEATPSKKKPGFTLIYDVARRFAQPLGIHLSEWEGRIIETKKGVVRLLPVRERSQQLFGEVGTELAADRIERVARGAEQLDLFSAAGLDDASAPEIAPKRGRKKAGVADEALKTRREATTLDRVHAAMLLQAGGRANALRSLLKSETERSPDFLRLANSLSALYPKDSEEKRLLDAMLLAAPR
ncbi:MAG: DUF1156 domain-containing protein [Bryobacteraceae bacterium]